MPETRRVLIRERPLQGGCLLALMLAAALLYAYGITAPTLTLEKFVVIEKTYSVLNGVLDFWARGQWFLFLVVGGFSLCLPAIKMVLLLFVLLLPPSPPGLLRRLVDYVDRIGRWSMLDVFVVATLVTSVQLGALAEVTIHDGIYAFGGCVLAPLAGSTWTLALLRDADTRARPA